MILHRYIIGTMGSELKNYMKSANSFLCWEEGREHHNCPGDASIPKPTLNMKVSALAFGALLGLASAQNAVVHNHCAATVYVQSFPYDGSAPGPLTTVPKGGTFSEKFKTSGSVSLMRCLY